MGNTKSKEKDVKNGGGKENGGRKLPTHHLPFQKKKKQKSSTVRRLVNLFNTKKGDGKKKIKIKREEPPSIMGTSGLYLGNKSSGNGNFTSYCSPYLLLQDNANDPLANFWPPLLHSHLSLISRNDEDQLSRLNVLDVDELGEEMSNMRKASLAEQDFESMIIHDVYSSVIQQARDMRCREEVAKEVVKVSSSRSGSCSSSSGGGGSGEPVTCSSGSTEEGEFEDACTSLVEKSKGQDVVNVTRDDTFASFTQRVNALIEADEEMKVDNVVIIGQCEPQLTDELITDIKLDEITFIRHLKAPNESILKDKPAVAVVIPEIEVTLVDIDDEIQDEMVEEEHSNGLDDDLEEKLVKDVVEPSEDVDEKPRNVHESFKGNVVVQKSKFEDEKSENVDEISELKNLDEKLKKVIENLEFKHFDQKLKLENRVKNSKSLDEDVISTNADENSELEKIDKISTKNVDENLKLVSLDEKSTSFNDKPKNVDEMSTELENVDEKEPEVDEMMKQGDVHELDDDRCEDEYLNQVEKMKTECVECQIVESQLMKMTEETVVEKILLAKVESPLYENIILKDNWDGCVLEVPSEQLLEPAVCDQVPKAIIKPAREYDKDSESSLSLSDGDAGGGVGDAKEGQESSCDGSESSVMEIGDDVWDEDDDDYLETPTEAAVNIKTKLVLDLLNTAEVDMENFTSFLNLNCPLEDKYHFLQVQRLFDANQIQDSGNLDELGRCFRVLSRYGLDLLKPVDERPLYWKKILLQLETPTCRWLSVQGAQEILLEFGYQRVESGLIFPEDEEPDTEAVAAWVVELLLAAHELSCFSLQAHPQPDLFRRSLTLGTSSSSFISPPEETVAGPSLATTSVQQQHQTEEKTSIEPAEDLNKSTVLNREAEGDNMIGRRTLVPWLTPAKDTSRPLPPPPSPPAVQQQQQQQRCHLCGSSSPAVRCEKCSNLIFCLSCDDMYHRHPKRRDHVRKLAQRPPVNVEPPPRPPPKITDLSSPPVPPPRRRKSQLSAPSSPVNPRKIDQILPDLPKKQFPLKFGSLKKLLPTMQSSRSAQEQQQQQQQAKRQPTQPRQMHFTGSANHQKVHSPKTRNNHFEEQWPAHPMDYQSSSDVDEEEDGRSTGTSSGGRGGYPIDDPWPRETLPPRRGGSINARTGTLERQHHQTSTMLRHRSSFTSPDTAPPYIKRDNPFFYHHPSINHSSSVMDLTYPHGDLPYPMPQVQSMSEGLDYAGAIAPCGCRPNWIGPDHLGIWIPPSRCPMHSSTAAMYPPPYNMPPQPPHWNYPHHPYVPASSPPLPLPPQPHQQQQQQQHQSSVLQASDISSSPPPLLSSSSSTYRPRGSFKREEQQRKTQNGKQQQMVDSSSGEEEEEPDEVEELTKVVERVDDRQTNGSKMKSSPRSPEVVKEEPTQIVSDILMDEQTEWECEHCTFLNSKDDKICAVCCKTRGVRTSPVPPLAVEEEPVPQPPVKRPEVQNVPPSVSPTVKSGRPEELYEEISNPKSTSAGTQCEQIPTEVTATTTSTTSTAKETPVKIKNMASTGTSPPPQTISTQTETWQESSEEEEEQERKEEEPHLTPHSQSSPAKRKIKNLRGAAAASRLRRTASLQTVNRRSNAGSKDGGSLWYHDGGVVRRTASRASLRDTSPSPPPSTITRNRRSGSQVRRRASAYDYSSRDDEPGDDEYDIEDDDDEEDLNWRNKDYYLNMEELVERRRNKTSKHQGMEIIRLVKEAEKAKFSADDLQVALYQCGNGDPIQWLRDNWKTMVDTVITLASRKDNDIGVVSSAEAKRALQVHKGNIWAGVTFCIESRQKKVKELERRLSGYLSREEVMAALNASDGDAEEALHHLNKTHLKPFSLKFYGPPTVGVENEAGALRINNRFASSSDVSKSQLEISGESPEFEDEYVVEDEMRNNPDFDHRKDFNSFEENSQTSIQPDEKTSSDSEFVKKLKLAEEMSGLDKKALLLVRGAKLLDQSRELSLSKNMKTPEKKQLPLAQNEEMKFSNETSNEKSEINSKVIKDSVQQATVDDHALLLKNFNGKERNFKAEEPILKKVESKLTNAEISSKYEEVILKNNENSFSDATINSNHENSSFDNDNTNFNDVEINVNNKESSFNNEMDSFNYLEDSFNHEEHSVNSIENGANNHIDSYNSQGDSLYNEEGSYKNLESLFNNIDSSLNHERDSFNYEEENFNNEEENFNNEEENFNNEEENFNNEEENFNNEEENFNNEEENFNIIESNVNNEIDSFDNLEGSFSNLESSFNNLKDSFNNEERSLDNVEYPKDMRDNLKNAFETVDEIETEQQLMIEELSSSNQNEIFYDAYEDEIQPSPPQSAHFENKPSPQFISQSQVQLVVVNTPPLAKHMSTVHVVLAQPSASTTTEVDNMKKVEKCVAKTVEKPKVIVKTLFVQAGKSSLVDSRLETVCEMIKPEVQEVVEVLEEEHSLAVASVTNVYVGDDFNRNQYSIKTPVETALAPVAEPQMASTSSAQSGDFLSSLPQMEITSADNANQIEPIEDFAVSSTEESSAFISSASESNRDSEIETDDDEDEVEPMEVPLPVKPDLGRRARQFLAEGKLPNFYKAELAVKLLDLRFDETEAIFAANECSDLYMAVSYLQQDCELCAGKFPMGKMVSMLNCVHRCCRTCAKDYFTLKIKERNITETSCPFCGEPDLSDETLASQYFNHLDIMLKNLVDTDIHEMFQRKLRDRALMNEPNFKWCANCGSGFITDPNRRRINCPDCKIVTCAHCNKLWERQHEGVTCQEFDEWKQANDPEYQKQGLETYLAENGINCPKCKFKYDMAKGGCMHFTCSQCKFEFCSGCGKPFRMAGRCSVSSRCARLGLHAHHPRNCLFHLRDKEPAELKKLLNEQCVQYEEGDDDEAKGETVQRCVVMEQRETSEGNIDVKCGREVEPKMAGLCRKHYVEYLVGLVGSKGVDPVSIMDGVALEQELRRQDVEVPERKPGELPEEYREVLLKVVLEKIPLEVTKVPYLARRPSKTTII